MSQTGRLPDQLDRWHTKWARGSFPCIVEGSKEHKQWQLRSFHFPPKLQATWDDIMGQMCAFVDDTNADIDMAYDWVCEMLDIPSFVYNNAAWDSFYSVWESCDNRNDLRNIYID